MWLGHDSAEAVSKITQEKPQRGFWRVRFFNNFGPSFLPKVFLILHLFVHYHETKNYPCLLPCNIGGAVALWGCEKVAQTELSPKAVQANQVLVPAQVAKTPAPAQAAWLTFVDKVERGEAVDPSGQYVAKGTKAPVDAAGGRLHRPKFDAATASFAQRYVFRSAEKAAGSTNPTPGGAIANFIQPCDCGLGGGGSGPGIISTFVSSEGVAPYSGTDNQNGYIYDLKVGRGYAQGDHDGIPSSYTVLNSDLNKGAGGPFIYIGFTRVPRDVSENPETIYQEPYNSGPVTLLGISKKYNYNDDYSYFASDSYPVWADTGIRLGFQEYDLNQDVGGTYIHARLSKYSGWGAPIEIGVLSSNSSTAQPPTGWTKVSTDLNEGAGGDYIYFCAKAH